MARTVKESSEPHVLLEHSQRQDLIRPARVRREFPKREAQQRLQQKETRWAPIAYGIFLIAILVIFCIAYITYAFSKYRNQILPGVRVDTVSVAGLTTKQAAHLIDTREAMIGRSPIQLVYGPRMWVPTQTDIGFYPQPSVTANHALNVGRTESLPVQLIDRLPLHPTHNVPLAYSLIPYRALFTYIRTQIADPRRGGIDHPSVNAGIVPIAPLNDDFRLSPARPGLAVDVPATVARVQAILGSLRKQTREVAVVHTHPAISNNDAIRILSRVKRFLSNTPIVGVQKRVFATPRSAFAHMLSFDDVRQKNGNWLIRMNVDSKAVRSYVQNLAAQIDRPAADAKINFSGGRVIVIQPKHDGRTLDQDAAYSALLKVVSTLTPRAKLRLKVAVTQPPLDTTNPASLGINTLLGEGTTSFNGAGATRLDDITAIAKSLDNTLLQPRQDISFNALVGNNWLDRVYDDRERGVGGQIVPGNHGAMQQVATTFLRAMYGAGLSVTERHSHSYRLSWYEPPVGLDAEVLPGKNWDLRFANTTHRYLLIETRVEPVREQLYIYVYGPRLQWKVRVDRFGKITKTIKHGPTIRREDPTLQPGEVRQSAWAHDGASTVVQRSITYPNGRVSTDEIDTSYQPWQAIIAVGSPAAPTPKPRATPQPSATSPGPQPTLSPTPNH